MKLSIEISKSLQIDKKIILEKENLEFFLHYYLNSPFFIKKENLSKVNCAIENISKLKKETYEFEGYYNLMDRHMLYIFGNEYFKYLNFIETLIHAEDINITIPSVKEIQKINILEYILRELIDSQETLSGLQFIKNRKRFLIEDHQNGFPSVPINHLIFMPTSKGFHDRQNIGHQKEILTHFEIIWSLDKIYADRETTIKILIPDFKKTLNPEPIKVSNNTRRGFNLLQRARLLREASLWWHLVRMRSYSNVGFLLIISRIILFISSRLNIKNVSVIAKSDSAKKIVIFIMHRANKNIKVKKRVKEEWLKILIKEYQRG
jgi:hypothetical protein